MSKRKAPRNKFEQAIWDDLVKSKVEFEYEPHSIPYTYSGRYLPDFAISNNGKTIYIETKGFLRPEHRRKMAAVKKTNPDLDLRIVFQKARPEYVRWAEKNGLPWSEGLIPWEWVE